MASWNDITEGSQLGQCPVCLCNVAKRRLARHTQDCFEKNKIQMETLGVIRCPFDQNHIIPLYFLNHHLDGNCQEVLNLLRKFYQKHNYAATQFGGAPPDYDSGIPAEFMNEHNRDLHYTLFKDLYGDSLQTSSQTQDNSSNPQPNQEGWRTQAPSTSAVDETQLD